MSSTTKAKSYLLVIVFPLLILTAWSCEKSFQPGVEMDQPQSPQLEVLEEDCPEGILAPFELNMDYSTHYIIEIPPPPSYRLLEDCMCRMQYIQLDFSFLPGASEIWVTDEYGNEVPFSGPASGPLGHYIRVEAADLMPLINVDFDPVIGEHPILVAKEGFCLIDNISGPFPPGENIYSEPFLRVNPNSFKNEIWVPTVMTAAI